MFNNTCCLLTAWLRRSHGCRLSFMVGSSHVIDLILIERHFFKVCRVQFYGSHLCRVLCLYWSDAHLSSSGETACRESSCGITKTPLGLAQLGADNYGRWNMKFPSIVKRSLQILCAPGHVLQPRQQSRQQLLHSFFAFVLGNLSCLFKTVCASESMPFFDDMWLVPCGSIGAQLFSHLGRSASRL